MEFISPSLSVGRVGLHLTWEPPAMPVEGVALGSLTVASMGCWGWFQGAPELIPLGRGSKAWAPAQGCCFLFGGRNFEIKEK